MGRHSRYHGATVLEKAARFSKGTNKGILRDRYPKSMMYLESERANFDAGFAAAGAGAATSSSANPAAEGARFASDRPLPLLLGGCSEVDMVLAKYEDEDERTDEDWFRIVEHRWLGGGRDAQARMAREAIKREDREAAARKAEEEEVAAAGDDA